VKKRSLGRTGLVVSEIGFGGVEIGIPYGIDPGVGLEAPAEEEAERLLRDALDAGINYFDTARAYGRSEKVMGNAFRGRRDEVLLCTKCSPLCDEKGCLPPPADLRRTIDDSLNKSLAALRTDYVDVYMLHSAHAEVLDNPAVAEIFLDYKRRQLARAIGVSTYSPEETRKAVESGVWDVVQLPFNLMDQRHGAFFASAVERGVGIVVRSVFLQGILTNRGHRLYEKLRRGDPQLKTVEQHRDRYEELLDDKIPTLPDLAVKFVLSHAAVPCVLIGTKRMSHVRTALAAADGRYLEGRELARAKELAYPDPNFLDLGKWLAMGWLPWAP